MEKFIPIRFKKLLSQLHIGEHFYFYCNGIIQPLQDPLKDLPEAKSMLDSLQSIFELEDNLFKIGQGSELSKEIIRAHEKRVGYFIFLWKCIDTAEYEDNPALHDAIYAMEYLHHTYKDLTACNYYALSGTMTNFLQDCETPRYQQAIQTLSAALDINLATVVAKMKTAHNRFQTLYEERALSREHIIQMGRLSKVRFEVDAALESLVDSINIAWLANEFGAKDAALSEKLITVKEIITGAIHQAKNSLAHRGKRKWRRKEKKLKIEN